MEVFEILAIVAMVIALVCALVRYAKRTKQERKPYDVVVILLLGLAVILILLRRFGA